MSSIVETPPSQAEAPPSPASLRDYLLLVRPRIIGLVLFTMTVAALVAGPAVPPWPLLAHSLTGAGLVIAGAIALNQRLERRSDALMPRTAARPLAAGRMPAAGATAFGVLASAAGLLYLALAAPWQVVALTLLSWVIYVWIYTPVKAISAWQTPLGALAGAMPALIGAAAAGSPGSLKALTLFGIVYFWQFPHAMAIAWLYRGEFASADVRVATVVDPSGRIAALLSLFGAALLLPVSLAPWIAGGTSWSYAASAGLLGLGYLACSALFLRRRDERTARWLLRASLVHLPVVLVAFLAS